MSALIGSSSLIRQPLHPDFDIPFLFIGEMNYTEKAWSWNFYHGTELLFLSSCLYASYSAWLLNAFFLFVCLTNVYSLFKVKVNQFFWKTMSHEPYAHIDMYIHVDIYMCMHTCPFLLWQLLCLWLYRLMPSSCHLQSPVPINSSGSGAFLSVSVFLQPASLLWIPIDAPNSLSLTSTPYHGICLNDIPLIVIFWSFIPNHISFSYLIHGCSLFYFNIRSRICNYFHRTIV